MILKSRSRFTINGTIFVLLAGSITALAACSSGISAPHEPALAPSAAATHTADSGAAPSAITITATRDGETLPAGPSAIQASPSSTPAPTAAPMPAITASPRAGESPEPAASDPDWVRIAPGIEAQTMVIGAKWPSEESPVVVVRIDPALARVTIRYDPANPVRVVEWADRLGSEATVVINAGYFQQTYVSAGLVVSDGMRYGSSFGATAGMAEGMLRMADGRPSIRSLASRPYDPQEPLDQAVQGLPMLVDHGEAVAFDMPDQIALRTAIAMDSADRLLLLHVADRPVMLRHLRDWLISRNELGIVMALNLDGGRSTGMVIGEPYPVRHNSVNRVPSVLVVTSR